MRKTHAYLPAREKARELAINLANKEPSPEVIEARESFAFFCSHVSRNSPDSMKPAPHHLEWHKELITGQDSRCLLRVAGQNLDLLAPRGSAKSSVLGLWVAWLIGIHTLAKKPLQILYISYSLSVARAKSATIKSILETPEYQEVFACVRPGKRWADDYWSIDRVHAGIRVTGNEEFTMVSSGMNGGITSKRCFVRGTLIDTEIGKIPIEELEKHVGTLKTLSYNHESERTEYKTIQAFGKRYTTKLVEITTSSGRTLRCTPDHPIYIRGQGYREARSLLQGDTIIRLTKPKGQGEGMSCMQQDSTNQGTLSPLQWMLPEGEEDRVSASLRPLQEDLYFNSLSIECQDKGGLCQSILQQDLFEGIQVNSDEEGKDMSSLWYQETGQWQDKEIMYQMLSSNQKKDNLVAKELPSLLDSISSQAQQNHVLQQGLCQQSSFREDDRNGQQQVQAWKELQQTVQGVKTTDTGEGQQSVCSLHWEQSINYSSHKPESLRQPAGELSYFVSTLPQQPSFEGEDWEYDTISSITELCDVYEPVYDIQVEGNHNLFANEILAHNCHLVIFDDPIKNAEQIASPEVREKMARNWATVIRPTMLDGARAICLGTRFRPDDLHCTTFCPAKGWKQIEQSAILEDDSGNEYSYWQDFWSLEYLRKLRQEDSISFSFQFQNRIIPLEELGLSPAWIHIDNIPTDFDSYAVGIDLAASLKTKADFTVLMLLGRKDDRFYFLDYRRGKWQGNMAICDALLGLYEEWHEPGVPFTVFVESQSYQASFKGDFVSYVVNQHQIYDLHCQPWNLRGDKLSHLLSISGIYANGLVSYNKYRFSKDDIAIKELTDFGATPHDDALDAQCLALQGLGARHKLLAV